MRKRKAFCSALMVSFTALAEANGPVVFGLALASAAMLGDLGGFMILTDEDVGEALVVTQQHVEAGV